MAEIKIPLQINLPDDWIEQIVERLKNDPDAEWVEIIRCKHCVKYDTHNHRCKHWNHGVQKMGFCNFAERREE